MTVELKTRVFRLYNGRYASLSKLAQAMEMDPGQIYRVKNGEHKVNEKFIIGAIKAFPGYTLNDLFYVAPDGGGSEKTTNEAIVVAGSRRDELVVLKEAGLSYAEIGRRLGISRERVRQIVTNKPRKTTAKKKPERANPDALLTLSEAAELLNIHVNTVRRWSNQGMLKARRIGNRRDRRFRQGDVESLAEDGEIE
jgi:excisionase family DNA binding protein